MRCPDPIRLIHPQGLKDPSPHLVAMANGNLLPWPRFFSRVVFFFFAVKVGVLFNCNGNGYFFMVKKASECSFHRKIWRKKGTIIPKTAFNSRRKLKMEGTLFCRRKKSHIKNITTNFLDPWPTATTATPFDLVTVDLDQKIWWQKTKPWIEPEWPKWSEQKNWEWYLWQILFLNNSYDSWNK